MTLTDYEALEGENESLKEQLDEQAGTISDLEDEISSLNTKAEELESQNDELRQALENIRGVASNAL